MPMAQPGARWIRRNGCHAASQHTYYFDETPHVISTNIGRIINHRLLVLLAAGSKSIGCMPADWRCARLRSGATKATEMPWVSGLSTPPTSPVFQCHPTPSISIRPWRGRHGSRRSFGGWAQPCPGPLSSNCSQNNLSAPDRNMGGRSVLERGKPSHLNSWQKWGRPPGRKSRHFLGAEILSLGSPRGRRLRRDCHLRRRASGRLDFSSPAPPPPPAAGFPARRPSTVARTSSNLWAAA